MKALTKKAWEIRLELLRMFSHGKAKQVQGICCYTGADF